MNSLRPFVEDESGVTAIEYGLIAAAIGLMLVTMMPFLREPLATIFAGILDGVNELSAP
jgi:pilus assembly protein Flp/PilA